MSFGSMWNELTGVSAKLPPDYARTIVNRAYTDVRRKNLWSFLLYESNWTSPFPVNAGTVTTVQGQNTVVFDPVNASPAILAAAFGPPTPVTQRQFRVNIGTIYNIWALANNGGTVTLTLDRKYQEPSQTGVAYSIFQCYYPSPVQDFWAWISVRDINDFNKLRTKLKRADIDKRDPQRTIYYIPTDIVPYQVDQNPASPTSGWQLFEMWGAPQQELTYQLYLMRKGMPLVNDSDTIPTLVVGEDCVMALARKYSYEWLETNWQKAWGMKPNFNLVLTESRAEYNRLFREYRLQDRATVDNFRVRLERGLSWPSEWGFFDAINNTANPGAPW